MIPEPDITISIWDTGTGENVDRPAWRVGISGLVVQLGLDNERYVITHQRSGMRVADPPCGCWDAALRLAEQLTDCGDWDRPGTDILADSEMRRRAKDLIADNQATAYGARPSDPVTTATVRNEALQR